MIQDAIEMGLDPVIAPDHRLWEESSCTQSALNKELWGDLQDDYKIDTTQGETSEMEQKEFKTGSIVMLNSSNIKMTVKNNRGLFDSFICRWFDNQNNLKTGEFNSWELTEHSIYRLSEPDKISIGYIITLNHSNIKMTVQDTLDNDMFICRWFNKKDNIKSEKFHINELSIYKTNEDGKFDQYCTGDVIILNSSNIKMTVQATLDHNICICRWLDKKGNLKSEEFDRCEVSLYKSYIIPDDDNNEDDKISLEEFLTFPTEDDAGASGMDNAPF